MNIGLTKAPDVSSRGRNSFLELWRRWTILMFPVLLQLQGISGDDAPKVSTSYVAGTGAAVTRGGYFKVGFIPRQSCRSQIDNIGTSAVVFAVKSDWFRVSSGIVNHSRILTSLQHLSLKLMSLIRGVLCYRFAQLQAHNERSHGGGKADVVVVAFGSAPGVPNW